MKWITLLLAAVLLCGCGGEDAELKRAMDLRARLLTADVSFEADITADYGDEIHSFSVYCEGDSQGSLGFQVTAPETIAGITGRIDNREGKLTFQDTVLAFPLLAEGQLSPVSAPWIFYTTLRGGYLTAAGMEDDLLLLTIDDSYEADALTVDIWVDGNDGPVRAEILFDGRRILTLDIKNFQIV